MKKTIGIVGYGFVGKAVAQLDEICDVNIYDPFIKEYSSVENANAAYLSDFVFVCVPTPLSTDSEDTNLLDMEVVDGCVGLWNWYNGRGEQGGPNPKSILVIKSTINPGMVEHYCRKYETNRIVHNPEFLTERTAMEDFRKPFEVIVGGDSDSCAKVIDMYKEYYSNGDSEPVYYAVDASMAELIKTTRNSFYALKISFFNEVYELCRKMGISYEKFREVFTLEGNHPWISKQHTQVPGPDGSRGFGGKCLPKDSEGLVELASCLDVDMTTLAAAVRSNKRRRE